MGTHVLGDSSGSSVSQTATSLYETLVRSTHALPRGAVSETKQDEKVCGISSTLWPRASSNVKGIDLPPVLLMLERLGRLHTAEVKTFCSVERGERSREARFTTFDDMKKMCSLFLKSGSAVGEMCEKDPSTYSIAISHGT